MFLRLSLSCTRGTSSFLSYSATRSVNKFFNPVQSLPRPSTGFSRGFSLSTSNVLNSGAHSARSNGRRRALGGAAAVASLGLGLATFARPVLCDCTSPSKAFCLSILNISISLQRPNLQVRLFTQQARPTQPLRRWMRPQLTVVTIYHLFLHPRSPL